MKKIGFIGVLCKFDLEKAYDHVNWKFLDFIMLKMDFGEKWIKWVYFCISSVQYSMLANGNPCVFFRQSKGFEARGSFITHAFYFGDGKLE